MNKFTGVFPINQMYDDMRKASRERLRATDADAVAKHYGVTAETVRHWIDIIIDLKA